MSVPWLLSEPSGNMLPDDPFITGVVKLSVALVPRLMVRTRR